jgi:hypothetical protein
MYCSGRSKSVMIIFLDARYIGLGEYNGARRRGSVQECGET